MRSRRPDPKAARTRRALYFVSLLTMVLLGLVTRELLTPQIRTGPRPEPKRIKEIAAPPKRRPPVRPAAVRVSIIDRSTSRIIPGIPVAVGEKYINSDSSGAVQLGKLKPGATEIAARARGYLLNRQRYRLLSGDNSLTIALEPQTTTPAPVEVIRRRQVYLTIDDGPSATWTPEVLDILKRENVPATFFLVGWRAEKRPELVRRIYLEGHTVGNHTYSHDYDSLYRGSAFDLTASYAKNGQILKTLLGYAPMVTRPPGGTTGNFRAGWQSAVTSAGYTTVLWNVTTGDGATETTSPQMVANAIHYLDKLAPADPAVVLTHDTRDPIVKALPAVIAEVRKRGYEFAPITDDLRIPNVILGPWRRR